MEAQKNDTKMKAVYTITERGQNKFWNRVGAGFVNRDGSINLRLDALPVNGSLQIRDWEPKEAGRRGAQDDFGGLG